MNQSLDLFKTTMPKTRPADFYLGCLDGCIFMDFGLTDKGCISLLRISFDGFGCCGLGDSGVPMSKEDSELFIKTYKRKELNQEVMTLLVKKTIQANETHIWGEALKRYNLIEAG